MTDLHNLIAASTALPTVQSINESMSPTGVAALPPRDYPAESVRRVADSDSQLEMSHIGLRRADLAFDTMRTWASAVDIIKRVSDTVSPIPEVCSISFSYPSLS
jgi:hypothetical protein